MEDTSRMVAFGETLRNVGYHDEKRLLRRDAEMGVNGGNVGFIDEDDGGATEGMLEGYVRRSQRVMTLWWVLLLVIPLPPAPPQRVEGRKKRENGTILILMFFL